MSPAEKLDLIKSHIDQLRVMTGTRNGDLMDAYIADCLEGLANVCESLINQPTFRPGDPVMDKQASV